jgi:anaerobic selenocysteine-containing dehydrogenase
MTTKNLSRRDFIKKSAATGAGLTIWFTLGDSVGRASGAAAFDRRRGANVARDYLLKNLGKVASRNGAEVPYSGRVDVRLGKTIDSHGPGCPCMRRPGCG